MVRPELLGGPKSAMETLTVVAIHLGTWGGRPREHYYLLHRKCLQRYLESAAAEVAAAREKKSTLRRKITF